MHKCPHRQLNKILQNSSIFKWHFHPPHPSKQFYNYMTNWIYSLMHNIHQNKIKLQIKIMKIGNENFSNCSKCPLYLYYKLIVWPLVGKIGMLMAYKWHLQFNLIKRGRSALMLMSRFCVVRGGLGISSFPFEASPREKQISGKFSSPGEKFF